MKVESIIGTAVGIILLLMVVKGADAIPLSDCLTLDGFLRYEFAVHTDVQNPNLSQNHDLTLSRFFLQTEWKYKPSDAVNFFANVRLLEDTTSLWDSHLQNYNAFPVNDKWHNGLGMEGGTDHFRAEVWELYGDVTLGDLWLRLGRQQIAWGEMIGSRFLDSINALDQSWNMAFEPEEFELIRIPAWSVRGIYQIKQNLGLLTDTSIEAFVNPGDWYPNFYGDFNSPFQVLPGALFNNPAVEFHDHNRGGDTQWGVRLGGKIGPVYLTLNYLSLYSQDFTMETAANIFHIDPTVPGGAVLDVNKLYKRINMFGVSANYAFPNPINTVVSFEGVYIPDQPYSVSGTMELMPGIFIPTFKTVDQGTFKYAFNLSRPTSLLPPTFLHASFANVVFQFSQNIYQGDWRRIGQRSSTAETFVFVVAQPLLYNNLTPSFQVVFDPRGGTSHYLRPAVRYSYGDHWYFDVWGTIFGGDPTSSFGPLKWADSVYGRITYQF